jgi:hypothetical protein
VIGPRGASGKQQSAGNADAGNTGAHLLMLTDAGVRR